MKITSKKIACQLIVVAFFYCFNFQIAAAQQNAKTVQADLNDVAWLAGHWKGEAFGGITEEIWAPPSGGSMMGAFKLIVDGEVIFYELETISEREGSLILQFKHFNKDLTGWEEKDKTVDFKLIKVETDKVYFEGFILERISENEINMYVTIQE